MVIDMGFDSRRDTNTFEDAGQGDKRQDIGCWECVLQLVCRGDASLGQGPRQEADVCLLVNVDFLQVGVERVFEASSDEVGLCVVGQSLLIELPLKVLESQCIVEDNAIVNLGRADWALAGKERGSLNGRDSQRGSKSGRETHGG